MLQTTTVTIFSNSKDDTDNHSLGQMIHFTSITFKTSKRHTFTFDTTRMLYSVMHTCAHAHMHTHTHILATAVKQLQSEGMFNKFIKDILNSK